MIKKQEGVWIAEGPIFSFSAKDIEFLEREAPLTQKKRARICFHEEGDALHQMLIAFCAGSENTMHSHQHAESQYVIKGTMLFEFSGSLKDCFLDPGEFLKIPPGILHKPIPLTRCVVLETCLK